MVPRLCDISRAPEQRPELFPVASSLVSNSGRSRRLASSSHLKIPRGPTVWEADFLAPALRDGLVFDQADIGHARNHAADVRDREAARGWGMPAQNTHSSRGGRQRSRFYASISVRRVVCCWPRRNREPKLRAYSGASASRGGGPNTGSVLCAGKNVGLSW